MDKQSSICLGENKHISIVLNSVIDVFQRRKIILNKTRLSLIQTLCQQAEPIGAIDLWLDIHKSKKISLPSVYNVLNLLIREGIVDKTREKEGSLYFLKQCHKSFR